MVEQMHKSGVSVAELVEETALGRAELRAGGGGLGREVERVQWMEVLDDFADYLAPGDLLLTTAYNLGDDRALQRTLAGRMLEAGAVAMVVKCGYYLESVPYAVRRQADDIDLPVFELPREVPFVEISQSIYERLVSGSYARLQRSAGIHRELVRLVVDGADLGTVVRRAAAMVGNPVVVEDDAGRRLGGWRPDGRPHWLGPGGLADAPHALVVPVVARGVTHGRVGLIPERPAQADDVQALEQVATVVALDIAKSDRERLTEDELVAAFVRDLVRGRAGDAAACQARARRLGVEIPDEARVLRLRGATADPGAVEQALDLLRERLPRRPLLARDGAEIVAVCSAGDEELVGTDLGWLAPGGEELTGGAGEAAGGPDRLGASHHQAGRALRLGRGLRGRGVLHRYGDVEAYDALLGDDGDRAARARARTIDRLPDDLRTTLALYLEHNHSVARTARELFVHRNTVHYRLRRIEALCELDLTRVEDRMLCQIALLSARMGDPAAGVV
ncbi:MAG TPA: PucR family transcriptional regulator [Gaiellales bacterium]|nr:PucR family transcriptional regulator [Gaiellales bacterium]